MNHVCTVFRFPGLCELALERHRAPGAQRASASCGLLEKWCWVHPCPTGGALLNLPLGGFSKCYVSHCVAVRARIKARIKQVSGPEQELMMFYRFRTAIR